MSLGECSQSPSAPPFTSVLITIPLCVSVLCVGSVPPLYVRPFLLLFCLCPSPLSLLRTFFGCFRVAPALPIPPLTTYEFSLSTSRGRRFGVTPPLEPARYWKSFCRSLVPHSGRSVGVCPSTRRLLPPSFTCQALLRHQVHFSGDLATTVRFCFSLLSLGYRIILPQRCCLSVGWPFSLSALGAE